MVMSFALHPKRGPYSSVSENYVETHQSFIEHFHNNDAVMQSFRQLNR